MRALLFLALLILLAPGRAFAQAAPPRSTPRGDASASVGWLHSALDDEVLVRSVGPRDGWIHDRATIGASLGVYWTEHVKTEIALETSNRSRFWQTETVEIDGRTVYRGVEHAARDTRVSLGGFYQFGRNAWVHPSVGGGVRLRRRSRISESWPAYIHDGSGPPTAIGGPEIAGPAIDSSVSAFGAAAVKAYVSPRAFFRADLQVDAGADLDDVVVRAGFGFDF